MLYWLYQRMVWMHYDRFVALITAVACMTAVCTVATWTTLGNSSISTEWISFLFSVACCLWESYWTTPGCVPCRSDPSCSFFWGSYTIYILLIFIDYFARFVQISNILLSDAIGYCVNGAVGTFLLVLFWPRLTEPAAFYGILISTLLSTLMWIIFKLMVFIGMPVVLRKWFVFKLPLCLPRTTNEQIGPCHAWKTSY